MDTETGTPRLPNIETYLAKAKVIVADMDNTSRNALLEREIRVWEQRYARFLEEPDCWLERYPQLSAFDFVETIAGLAQLIIPELSEAA